MDGAEALRTYARPALQILNQAMPSRRVAVVCVEALGESPSRAATGADLGGSSKYSNENFEGRSGEGFHVNSI